MSPSSWVRLVVFTGLILVLIGLLVSAAYRRSHHEISNPDHLLHTP